MIHYLRLSGLLLFASFFTPTAQAQSITLLDNFDRANSTTVGNGWTETETVVPSGASITDNRLRLNSTTAGRDYIVRDLSTRYDPILNRNPGRLIWAWNTRQSRPSPSGFDSGNYGSAFVLAASSANLLATTTSGYAVIVGNSGAPDPFKLVRFTGGLNANSRLTTIFQTNSEYGTAFLTLRVTYFPDENSWTLEASPNTTAFEDPSLSTSFTTIGTGTDATYTGTSLPYLACFWNHNTAAADNAVFDNIYITGACTPAAEPTAGPTDAVVDQLTSTSARLRVTAGSGTARLLVLRTDQATTSLPADGTAYGASASYGAGNKLSGSEFVVANDASGSVSLTNLLPNTIYYYAAYEAAGTSCAVNYRQTAPLTGSFTTPPCLPEASPTTATSQGTATAATGSITFGWLSGDGARRLVVVRAAQPVSATPADAQTYAASARFGAGEALSTGEFAVYEGAGSSVTVTGLVAGQTYYAAVYEVNGAACSAKYLLANPATASAVVPAAPVSTSTYNFYRGNLHSHSGYSDGNKDAAGAATPADSYVLAQQAREFNFLGISEHNHAAALMSLPDYAKGVQQAKDATRDGSFVALYGMEWGTISGGGHVIIYGYDKLIGWEPGNYDVFVEKGNYTSLFATLAQEPGAVSYLAHPDPTDYNNLFNSPLNPTTAQVLVGSAMRSGPAFSTNTDYSNPSTSTFEPRYKAALRIGYHVGPTIDHDTHNSVFGRSTRARLVLLAPTLTRAALLDALQQRRFYAADDENTNITLQISAQPMGSVLTQRNAPTIEVAVTDPDANDAVASIALFAGIPGGTADATQLTSSTGSATLTYTDPIPDQATYYYYAVVTQTDGDKFWTAPIRYTRNDALAQPGGPLPVTLTRFQATLQNENQAVLRWATATEQNNAYFAVERSTNGRDFQEVGRVKAAGTSAQAHTYELRDPRPLTTLTYYRLRQVDLDQTAVLSAVITLSPSTREAPQASVYPNPATGAAAPRLALRGLSGRPVAVRVLNLLGQVITTQQLTPTAYQQNTSLMLPAGTTPGIYLVSITDGLQTWSTRLTLQP